MIHLATIPVTGTSVNPARSTGPALVALFGGESWPIEQLWLFWVAPLVGALVGGRSTASSADLPTQGSEEARGHASLTAPGPSGTVSVGVELLWGLAAGV